MEYLEQLGLNPYWGLLIVACALCAQTVSKTVETALLKSRWKGVIIKGVGTVTGSIAGAPLHYLSQQTEHDYVAAIIYGTIGGLFSDAVLYFVRERLRRRGIQDGNEKKEV